MHIRTHTRMHACTRTHIANAHEQANLLRPPPPLARAAFAPAPPSSSSYCRLWQRAAPQQQLVAVPVQRQQAWLLANKALLLAGIEVLFHLSFSLYLILSEVLISYHYLIFQTLFSLCVF